MKNHLEIVSRDKTSFESRLDKLIVYDHTLSLM